MAVPVEQYEIYAEFGFTAEKGQLLETEAGNFALAYLTFFLDTGTLSPEEKAVFRDVTEDLNKKTFGALLRYIKRSVSLDDSITKAMDEALDRRNYLTHHFFRTHNFALFSDVGRKVMIDELHEIQGKLNVALTMLQLMTAVLDKIAGKQDVPEELAIQFQTRGKKVNI